VKDCELVSNQISGVLDVEDPIKGRYTLEVSSPGLDRPLFERSHYERFLGSKARIRLTRPIEGRRNFTGYLLAVDEDKVTLKVDETEFELPFSDIQQARLVPEE
jgi:ribosome maturation factor RimP